MKYIIKHEIRGRLRIHVIQKKMTCAEAEYSFSGIWTDRKI